MENLRMATKNANKIVNENLPKLSYFNDVNFRKNAPNLKRYITKDVLDGNQWLIYLSSSNSMIVDESRLPHQDVPIEALQLLIVHEYIHMASTDVEKGTIGFESKDLPITYNEALTQWLALKLCYGDKIEELLPVNFVYPESVKRVHELIKDVGEEVIFNHFFEANTKKNVSEIPKDKKDKWINTILELSTSYEEKLSKSSMDILHEKINETKQQGIK